MKSADLRLPVTEVPAENATAAPVGGPASSRLRESPRSSESNTIADGVADEIHPVAGLQFEDHMIIDDISDGALAIRDPPPALEGRDDVLARPW